MMKITILTIIFLLFVALVSFAETYYVRSDATGMNNGSDWANAWKDTSDITWGAGGVRRDDTIYIADGNYSEATFDLGESGTNYVYIKKATILKHGTDTGWSNKYGDGQAIFIGNAAWVLSTGYWDIDGVNGKGEDDSSYGFKINVSGCGSGTHHRGIIFSGDLSYIRLQHIAIENCGESQPSNQSCLYSADGADNIYLAYMWMTNGQVSILNRRWDDCIIEHCYFRSNWSSSDYHGEHISTANSGNTGSNIIRYSVFRDGTGSGVIHVVTDSDYNWEIYGNIFINCSTGRTSISAGGSHALYDSKLYNNTFVDCYHAGISGSNGSGNKAYNNLFYNCELTYFGSSTTHEYNWYYNCGDLWEPELTAQVGVKDPFTNLKMQNFHLTSNTLPGLELNEPFNYDFEGKLRGADENWDRGAFEYDDRETGNIGPQPPEGLRISN